ncbi:MAG: hypothetical protein KDC10_13470 [Calditrichaeota bacterium]|nr:hypothetical protein [Calditrichota bacterium]
MRFVETPVFTRRLKAMMKDDDYRALQIALLLAPERGKLIQDSGGLRKFRWSGSGRGKRGGVRVIYCWAQDQQTVYLLLIYARNEQEELSASQLGILRILIREGLE